MSINRSRIWVNNHNPLQTIIPVWEFTVKEEVYHVYTKLYLESSPYIRSLSKAGVSSAIRSTYFRMFEYKSMIIFIGNNIMFTINSNNRLELLAYIKDNTEMILNNNLVKIIEMYGLFSKIIQYYGGTISNIHIVEGYKLQSNYIGDLIHQSNAEINNRWVNITNDDIVVKDNDEYDSYGNIELPDYANIFQKTTETQPVAVLEAHTEEFSSNDNVTEELFEELLSDNNITTSAENILDDNEISGLPLISEELEGDRAIRYMYEQIQLEEYE